MQICKIETSVYSLQLFDISGLQHILPTKGYLFLASGTNLYRVKYLNKLSELYTERKKEIQIEINYK